MPVLGPRISEIPSFNLGVAILLFILLWVNASFIKFCECVNIFVDCLQPSPLSWKVGRNHRLLNTAVHFTCITLLRVLQRWHCTLDKES